jgi:hypothetical protein
VHQNAPLWQECFVLPEGLLLQNIFPKRFSMRSHVKTIVVVLGIVTVAACNEPTVVNGDASGTYALTAVNGSPLPFLLAATTTDTVVITSGSITINTDGTFVESLSADQTTGGVKTSHLDVCPGTYSQSGNAFTFRESTTTPDPNCGAQYSASWDGANTVSLFFTGFQLDYIMTTN